MTIILQITAELISAVANADHRAELVNLYEQRATEMEAA